MKFEAPWLIPRSDWWEIKAYTIGAPLENPEFAGASTYPPLAPGTKEYWLHKEEREDWLGRGFNDVAFIDALLADNQAGNLIRAGCVIKLTVPLEPSQVKRIDLPLLSGAQEVVASAILLHGREIWTAQVRIEWSEIEGVRGEVLSLKKQDEFAKRTDCSSVGVADATPGGLRDALANSRVSGNLTFYEISFIPHALRPEGTPSHHITLIYHPNFVNGAAGTAHFVPYFASYDGRTRSWTEILASDDFVHPR